VTCRDAERLIDTFFDGELDGRLMREAALHVTRCRRCEGEIQDRERIHDVLKSAVDADVAGVDLAAIWAGIEPAIDREVRARKVIPWRLAAASVRGALFGRRAEEPDAGVGSWLAPRVAGFAVLAASLVLAVSLATREGSSPTTDPGSPVGSGERVASDTALPRPELVASAPAKPAAPARLTQASTSLAAAGAAGAAGAMMRPVAARSRRHGGQVRIESVDSRAGAMAMWSVPANDTAVIWLGDADPRLRPAR
jgi:hypothetical protein